MKRLIVALFVFILVLSFSYNIYSSSSNFEKGVAYLLLKDYKQARIYFKDFFKNNSNPIVRRGFELLTGNDNKGAKDEFKRYLNMNFRSLHAIVGISLSLSGVRASTSKENLLKSLKLNKSFSASYACLGMEYLKERNFPLAKKHLLNALSIKNLVEYRMLLGELYIREGRPEKTVLLISNDLVNNSDVFFLNFLMSRALFNLNRIERMGKYIRASRKLNGARNDVQLLYANYLLEKGEPKNAKVVLKELRYKDVNPDYIKSYGKTLLRLGSSRAKNFLYNLYSINKWDSDVNRLLGLFYFKNKTEKSNIQNWIYRAIISGDNVESLKKIFKSGFNYPKLDYLGFVDVRKIFWIDDKTLFVVGVLSSGRSEKMYLLDFAKKKILTSYGYDGVVDGVYFSKKRDRIILETEDPSSRKKSLYAMIRNPKGYFQFKSIYTVNQRISSFEVVFNTSGTIAYFIDKNIRKTSFESPFSIVNRFGEKRPVYTGLSNFGIYKYVFSNGRFTFLDDSDEIEEIESIPLKKFLMVYNAAKITKEIRELIVKGENLDSFSSELVKIVFSKDIGSFLIYLSDLKNPFQGVVFDNETGKIDLIESKMFLGKNRFTELEIADFDSKKNIIVFNTKDDRKELIMFDYKSKLYSILLENYFSGCFDSFDKRYYIFTERNRRNFLTETLLKVISVDPFWIEEIPARRDLKSVIKKNNPFSIEFSTNGGEIFEMGEDNSFVYKSPSFEGSVHGFSPNGNNVAVFVNNKLFLMENNRVWQRKPVSKK